MNNKNTVFLYHYPCADGFTAAWAAHQVYPEATIIKETHSFTETQTLLEDPNIGNKTIIYLDICPPREDLIELHKLTSGKTKVLDHHLTAERECGDLPYVYIDKTRSGAGIAWDKLTEGRPRPFLVDLVEDRDIWKWEIPNAQEYLIWLDTLRFTYDNWDRADKLLSTEEGKKSILTVGKAYKEFRDFLIHHRIITRRKIHAITLDGQKLPCINAPTFQSQIGDWLANKTKAKAGVIYYRGYGQWYFSLRSTNEGPDVSLIAKKYGGGGHRTAAGFVVKRLSDLDTWMSAASGPGTWIPALSDYTSEELDNDFPELPDE